MLLYTTQHTNMTKHNQKNHPTRVASGYHIFQNERLKPEGP